MRDPFNAGEGNVFPKTNTDGEQHIRKFDDPAKSFKSQSQEEREFYTMVLHSSGTTFGKDTTTDIRDFPLNTAIWSQFTSDCL